VEHPDDEAMRVSHETIYQSLYCQARGELTTQLTLALRTGRTRRVVRPSSRPKQARITGMVTISERPAEAEDRAVPGHWEGDLIIGQGGKSQIITLVERTTGYLLLGRVPDDRTADRVATILGTLVPRLPQQLWRSLTWDQGDQMAAHATVSVRTGVPVFFADPHSPWQRGSNVQRAAPPVLPQGHRPVRSHPGHPRRGRRATQRPAPPTTQLENPRRRTRPDTVRSSVTHPPLEFAVPWGRKHLRSTSWAYLQHRRTQLRHVLSR